MEIRDLADELQAILDGERPRLSKAEMREYMECLRAFAPIAAQDEAVLEIGECAEVIWHQGGPCQLPPGAKLYPRSEPKYIEEIAEALGDPTLISLSQVATGIRDLKAERARVPDGWGLKPSKATGDMVLAGIHENLSDPGPNVFNRIWAAMFAAAPSQPEDAGEVDRG